MLHLYGLDTKPDPELKKFVAGSGINHSGSTTLLLNTFHNNYYAVDELKIQCCGSVL